MKFDKLRMLVPVGVIACIVIAVLVVPVTSTKDCPRECPQKLNFICGYNRARNCYRAFENDCVIDMVNCYRPKTYVRTEMDDCGDPALWCINKNVND